MFRVEGMQPLYNRPLKYNAVSDNNQKDNINRNFEFSKNASDAISAVSKAGVSFKGCVPPLLLLKNAVKYFGIDDYTNIGENEGAFNQLKNKKLNCSTIGLFVSPCDEYKNNDVNGFVASVPKLLDKDLACAKMTTVDDCFDGVLHTVGFVRNENTLYVLDSLGNELDEIQPFHKYLSKMLSVNAEKCGINRIIFNKKQQQNEDMLTCNHWTYANIEALKNSLAQNKKIDSPEALDEVLPRKIENILINDYLEMKK